MPTQFFLQAQRYANSLGHISGVVVFWDGQVQGWMDFLRDPQDWQPGCIAVCVFSGRQWLATGGDSYNGSKEWTPFQASQDLIFDDVVIKLTVSGDSCAAPLATAPVEVSAPDFQLPREGSLLSGSQTGQGGDL